MTLVDLLGLVAGAVWISVAIYCELVREDDLTEYTVLFLSVGAAIWLMSSAVWTGPWMAEVLATLANLLLTLVGFGAWYWLEAYGPRGETADEDLTDDPAA